MRPEIRLRPAAQEPILIVEDNEVNALILGAMLRKHGYDSAVACNGIEGISMTALHQPRLILMDLQMPHLDGFAAAMEIRRVCDAFLPVMIAVTANAGFEVRDACREAGFAAVLAKPIVLDDLIATVRRFLPLA